MPDDIADIIITAEYIHEMALELQILANNKKLVTVSYLLSQCAMECDRIAREENKIDDTSNK